MAGRRPVLRVIDTQPEAAVARLHMLVRDRSQLRGSLRDAWWRLEPLVEQDDLERWVEASLGLLDISAGPACLRAFWRSSLQIVGEIGMEPVARAAELGRLLCRRAGASVATRYFEALAEATRLAGGAGPMLLWAEGLTRLAQEAPESVQPVIDRTSLILTSVDAGGFLTWLSAGLRVGAKDKKRRLAFFALEDPLSRRLIHRSGEGLPFSEVERRLKAYVTALWGIRPAIRAIAGEGEPMRRTRVVGNVILVPEVYRGVPAEAAGELFRAALAHAAAHVVYTPTRIPIGDLKPLQVAIVTLIEDARVELLAMRRFPGLRRLWHPYHTVSPSGPQTAPALLARLARALFDPDYQDPNGWVRKGRTMFQGQAGAFLDPQESRRIGSLLGNDIGQMRIQFNPKSYTIEPAYRDDGLGLWDFGDDQPSEPEVVELTLDSVRLDRREMDPDDADREKQEPEESEDQANRAREQAVPEEGGIRIATYPEWDYTAGEERADWATVLDCPARPGDRRLLAHQVEAEAGLLARVRALVRSVKVGRAVRQKRRHEGEELDIDAVIEAEISRRGGETPDPRIHQTKERRHRDVASMILLDTSESTRDPVPGTGKRVLDLERIAAAVLGEAMDALGDPFALWSFASAGHEEVRFVRVKDFADGFGDAMHDRLAGLEPGLSTRLGTALRHGAAELAGRRNHRKLLLIITDGEPSDIDVDDPRYLIEDARRAVLDARGKGIDVFCVGLDPTGHGSGRAIFGATNYIPITRLAELPSRLAMLYFRLAVR